MALLRIGSRGSQLALWQANHVAAQLRERGHQVEIEIIKTTGDKFTQVPFAQVGVKGMFTKEIEEALLEGRVDLAVHSLKDLPGEIDPKFELAAITVRQDARDALLSARYAGLAELPQGARVGTGSLRRQAQLRAVRPDLVFVAVRGNVDTRLRKLEAGEFEALILAAAGLNRLERAESVRELLPLEQMCPAAGQGALAIEIRAEDAGTGEHLAFLDHPATRLATSCERALLRVLGGGCQVPIGAYAQVEDGEIALSAVVARPDGSVLLRESERGTDAEVVAARAGKRLLDRGAAGILREIYGQAATPEQP